MAKLSKEQLAKLTKEQKLALLDVIEEKKRRAKLARRAFAPHEGQLPIITSKATKRVLICGNGFGKTALGVNEVLWAAQGFNPVTNEFYPVPSDITVVLDAPAKVADVWLPEIKKWTVLKEEMQHKDGKPYVSRISFDNGSQIRFMFHLMEPMAFESLENDLVVLDEPPPRNVWVALLRSGRKKGRQARFLLIGTPIAQQWLKQFHADWLKGNYPDTEFFQGSTEANKANLSDDYINVFASHLTEREKATRLHGQFFSAEGEALSGIFNRHKHIVSPDNMPAGWQSWPAALAVDSHTSKPTHACIVVAGPDNQLYYVAERAVRETARQFATFIKSDWMLKYNIVDMIIDSAAGADMTSGEGFRSFLDVCRSEGVLVRPTSYEEKSDEDFLSRIQDALYIPDNGEPKLKILSTCPGLVKDIELVAWKPIKNTEMYQPKLEISNRDYLSTLKYALATNLTWSNARRKPLRTSETTKKAVHSVSTARRSLEGGYLANKSRKKPIKFGDF